MKHSPEDKRPIESRKAVWMIAVVIIIAAVLFTISGSVTSSKADAIQFVADYTPRTVPPPDAQSTTGPIPPVDVSADGIDIAATTAATTTISDVPIYIWRHGCGPTAAGMVVGYWDGQGYGTLVPGDAYTQTAAVDEMMASGDTIGDVGTNYADYCEPIDEWTPTILPDKSEPPIGDEHPDNCVADYMKTSQSAYFNRYGWSWFSHVGPALQSYTRQALGGDYFAITENLDMAWTGTLNWDSLRAEIDAGRPMIFLVDTDADGSTDHFVTVVGYGVIDNVQYYACLTTWFGYGVEWFEFAEMQAGQPWGVYSATTYRIMILDQHLFFPSVRAIGGAVGDI